MSMRIGMRLSMIWRKNEVNGGCRRRGWGWDENEDEDDEDCDGNGVHVWVSLFVCLCVCICFCFRLSLWVSIYLCLSMPVHVCFCLSQSVSCTFFWSFICLESNISSLLSPFCSSSESCSIHLQLTTCLLCTYSLHSL